MKSLILLTITSLALAQSDSSCFRYTCATSEHSLQAGECSLGVKTDLYKQFYVKPCPSGKVCTTPVDVGTETCKVGTDVGYPGTKCDSTITCNLDLGKEKFDHCVSGKCTGLPKGADCTSSEQCSVGQYCNEQNSPSKCEDWLSEGDTCSILGSCGNSYVCNGKNKCSRIYDIETGDKCSLSYECEYGLCYHDGPDDDENHCYELESENGYPHKCQTDADCTSKKTKSKSTGGLFQLLGTCSCGKNPNGDKYCSLFHYDYYAKKYFAKLKKWYHSHDINQCNISSGPYANLACAFTYMDPDEYEEFVYLAQQALRFPELINVESCVVDTYHPHFEDSDDDFNESDFAALLLLPFLFSLI